eukprot:129911_1
MNANEPNSDDNENDNENDNDDEAHKQTLMKLMLSNPGLWRELLDASKEKESKNEIDKSNQLEYLRIFCDWKNYLQQLFDMNEDDEELLDDKLLSNKPKNNTYDNEKKSKSAVLESISDIPMDQLSPYIVLDLLIIERQMKKRNAENYLKSNKEKLESLMKYGVYNLKHKLYDNKIRFFEPNFKVIMDKSSQRYLCQQQFQNSIDLSLSLYHKFMIKLNVKNEINDKVFAKSYSVFHLLQKIGQQNEFNKLLSIFNETNYSFLIPNSVINTIAEYSCIIHGKCTNDGSVHFIYAALMPSKHIYERLWYVKQRNGETKFDENYSFSNVEEIAEVVHIFEPCHCDPRFVAEGKFGTMEVVLYYSFMDVYCIVASDGVELIDFELPLYLQYESDADK